MGEIIKFPSRAMTVDEVLIALARRIAADHGASDEDAYFMETEAEEIRDRYFSKTMFEVSITFDDTPQRVDEIRRTIIDAMESMMNDFEKDQLRMAAEILTLKLMLRRHAI